MSSIRLPFRAVQKLRSVQVSLQHGVSLASTPQEAMSSNMRDPAGPRNASSPENCVVMSWCRDTSSGLFVKTFRFRAASGGGLSTRFFSS